MRDRNAKEVADEEAECPCRHRARDGRSLRRYREAGRAGKVFDERVERPRKHRGRLPADFKLDRESLSGR